MKERAMPRRHSFRVTGSGRSLAAILCSLFVMLLASEARALNPDRSLAQYQHTVWLQGNGAPADVHAFAQTPDGLLWMATATGLFRFDGTHFDLIESLGGVALPTASAQSVATDRSGHLWIGGWPLTGSASGKVNATNEAFEDRFVFAVTARNGKLTHISSTSTPGPCTRRTEGRIPVGVVPAVRRYCPCKEVSPHASHSWQAARSSHTQPRRSSRCTNDQRSPN